MLMFNSIHFFSVADIVCLYIVKSCTYVIAYFSWKVDRDICSAHCGHGTAKQYIACSLTTRYNTTLVDIKHCEKRISEIGPRPKDVVVCYGKCLETNWKFTDWTRVRITSIV